MIAATILSAGSSIRMGQPKALLTLGGRTFLDMILETSRSAGLEPRFLVLGSDRDKILTCHDLHDVTVLTNASPKTGPIGSIRATLIALGDQRVDGLLVWPVDLPHVSLETIDQLRTRFLEGPEQIAVPTFAGKRGHPTLFGSTVFADLRAIPEGQGANTLVRRDSTRVVEVPVSDPAVVSRINTPDEYQRLLKGRAGTPG